MNKLVALGLLLLLVIPVVMGAIYTPPTNQVRERGVHRFNEYAYDPRIQYKKLDVWVHLTPLQHPTFARGYPPFFARGTARVQSVRSAYKPTGEVDINVKDLRPSGRDNTYYQAWLYDSDSGYTLNVGQFETMEGGVGSHQYRGSHYFDAYDFVLITREKRGDLDPRPSNDEVLIGKIEHKAFYEPKPLLGERASYGYTYYGE